MPLVLLYGDSLTTGICLPQGHTETILGVTTEELLALEAQTIGLSRILTEDNYAVLVLCVGTNDDIGAAATIASLEPLIKIAQKMNVDVGSSRVDLQACKLEYSIVSPK